MEDDKRVNYKLDAINKLINNLKLSISGNKEHDELGENNVIVNLDEISQKITELHEMVKAEFDEFENQHKSESDETQTLLTEKFTLVLNDLNTIKQSLTTINNSINSLKTSNETNFNKVVTAINNMKASNDTKNDAIITALQGLVTKVNQNTNNFITEFDFRFGPYFVPNKVGTNKKADYNWIRGNNGQDTDKAVRVLLLSGGAYRGSAAGSGGFRSGWVQSDSRADVGFFTTVKLD